MTLGLLLILIGGAMNGSFTVPMKRMKGWAWEHGWLMWAFFGTIVVPLGIALTTVSRPWEVYSHTPPDAIAAVALFGFIWGVSSILFGIGVDRVGVALGFAIILGISSAIGSLVPLFSKDPEALLKLSGWLTLAGVVLQVSGVACCGIANHLKEPASAVPVDRNRARWGLIICIVSGLGASSVNMGLVYGGPVMAAAEALGTPHQYAVNAIWPLLFGGGFLTNGGYCLYLIRRRESWSAFRQPGAPRNVFLGCLMGVLWMGSNLVYANGSARLGPLGLALGWPIMMGAIVLTANTWGKITGEWAGASRAALRWMAAGVLILLAGVSLIGAAAFA